MQVTKIKAKDWLDRGLIADNFNICTINIIVPASHHYLVAKASVTDREARGTNFAAHDWATLGRWTCASDTLANVAKSNDPFRLAILTVKPDKAMFQNTTALVSLKFCCNMRCNRLISDGIINLNLRPSPGY